MVFCLVAALGYRASIAFLPAGLVEDIFVLLLAGVLLAVALLARASKDLHKYWQIPFAFFIFTVAGFLGDVNVSPLEQWFIRDILREAPTVHNPLASSVHGTVVAQLFGTVCLVLPILILTRISGSSLSSIFVGKGTHWVGLVVGIVGFLLFYALMALGLSNRFFPNNGVPLSRLLALTPALILLALANGIREELQFRGLFLSKYGTFLGPFSSNLLSAFIFASFHAQVRYSRSLPIFLVVALIEGLILGFLMQRSRTLYGAAILHAGTDLPIFLVSLSYAPA